MIPAHDRDLVTDCRRIASLLRDQIEAKAVGRRLEAKIPDPFFLERLLLDCAAFVEAERRRLARR